MENIGQASLSLMVVIALIALCAFIWRALQHRGISVLKSEQRRCKVLEVLPIDPRRRLILLSLDQQEFLLMTGPSNDLLVPTSSRHFSKGEVRASEIL